MRFSRGTSRALVAGALIGVVALAGCSAAPATPPESSGPAELSLSNWQWLEDGKGPILWDSVKDYSGQDGNVTLKKIEIPFANYADKISTELGAGQGPDVMVLQDSQFVTLAEAGVLEPLDDIAEELSSSLNSTNDSGVFAGGQYGFNWERPNYAMIYNRDVLSAAGIEAPTTFEEFSSAITTIHETEGIAGFAGRHQTAEVDGWTLEMANWIYGFGGALSDGKTLTIDTPENVAAVEAYLKTFNTAGVPRGDDASTFRAKFGQGQVGILFENSGVAVTMTSNPSNIITGENLGSAALPFEHPGAHSQLVLAVNAKSKNKDRAKEFVRWVLSEEGQTALRPGLGASTLATDTPPSAEFLAANPWAPEFLELAKKSTSTLVPGFEGQSKVVWRGVLTGVERLLLQGGDVSEGLSQVQKTLDSEVTK